MLDAKGKVVAINEAARALLECGEEPLDGAKLSRLLPADPVSRMHSERRTVKELVFIKGRVYQMRMSPVQDENGDLTGMVIAFRDFEEERKADEMTTELVGVVSHELRTPLTAISNALGLVGGGKLGSLSPRQNRFVELAIRNVEQLVGIINDFVDLSKIEARRMQLDLVPTALPQQVENAVASLQAQAEAKGIALRRAILRDVPDVFAHGPSIHRVVANLVGNAIKFTDRGGVINVEVIRADGDEVGGRAGAIRVTVSDTGIGVPKGDLDVIFDKFHRSEAGQTPGTGLGLSISRELVKAHHGRIWAESQKGCGSSFSFVIPILSEEELLMRALSLEIDRAAELQAPMVVVVGRLQGADGLRARDEKAYQETMDAILAMTRKLVRRFSDLVLARKDTGEVVIVLPRTPRDGGSALATRLVEAMKRDFAHRPDLSLRVAAAQYPEEGLSPGDLYRAASEKIGEIVAA
jgi:signal transduction histidine kinase